MAGQPVAMEIGEGGSGWMQRTEPRRGPTVPRTMRDLNQSSICKSATSESCPHTTQHHFRMPFFQHKTSQSRGSLGPHKPLSVDGGHPRFWSATLRLCAGVQKHHWLTAADRQDVPWLEWRGIGGSLWYVCAVLKVSLLPIRVLQGYRSTGSVRATVA